jgi:hypothetical protein
VVIWPDVCLMACKMRVGGGECSEVMDKQVELYPCAMTCEQRSPARTQQPRQIVVDELPQALLNCSRGKIQPHRLEKLGGPAFSAHRKRVMNHTADYAVEMAGRERANR